MACRQYKKSKESGPAKEQQSTNIDIGDDATVAVLPSQPPTKSTFSIHFLFINSMEN